MKSRSGAARRTFQVVYKQKPKAQQGRHLIGVPVRRVAAAAETTEPLLESRA